MRWCRNRFFKDEPDEVNWSYSLLVICVEPRNTYEKGRKRKHDELDNDRLYILIPDRHIFSGDRSLSETSQSVTVSNSVCRWKRGLICTSESQLDLHSLSMFIARNHISSVKLMFYNIVTTQIMQLLRLKMHWRCNIIQMKINITVISFSSKRRDIR